MEPTWLKNGRDTNGRAYTLCQKNLIVLFADGCHHDSKEVHQTSTENEPSRPVLIIDRSDNRTHPHDEEDLQ